MSVSKQLELFWEVVVVVELLKKSVLKQLELS